MIVKCKRIKQKFAVCDAMSKRTQRLYGRDYFDGEPLLMVCAVRCVGRAHVFVCVYVCDVHGEHAQQHSALCPQHLHVCNVLLCMYRARSSVAVAIGNWRSSVKNG